jgi:UDP-N-acetylglucosamine acyltransferase
MNQAFIHPTAIVDAKATLGQNCHIGPYCLIGPDVTLGDHCTLHSNVILNGHTSLGSHNEIFPFASLGHAPQDLKYHGEPTKLIIGNHNTIRESVTIQPGTIQDRGETLIGNHNLIMAYTHIAHDCVIQNHVILSNGAQLSGHVNIEDHTILGGLVGIHQFCHIGKYAFIAGGSMIVQDVPPFCLAEGNRARLRGLNSVGLRRHKFSSETLKFIKEAYKIFFIDGHPTFQDAFDAIQLTDGFKVSSEVKILGDFINASSRGVTRP